MLFEDEEKCESYLTEIDRLVYRQNETDSSMDSELGCNGTFDKVICWQAVKANSTVVVPCPNFKGVFDPDKFLYKYCTPEGLWDGYNLTGRYSGFTNFETCYTEIALKELNKIKLSKNTGLVYHVASYIELSGLILSFISICLSLFIFAYHKSLRCRRTKIHLNLFVAILFQSILRITFFIDRFLYKVNIKDKKDQISFESQFMLYNKAICPILMSLLEYFQLCNFMWMLSEGVYLNILLTYSVFQEANQKAIISFYLIGWGLPAVITLAWSLTLYHSIGIDDVCWSGYYDRSSYWIIQGPVLISLIINFCCLSNVIRILAKKLKLNNQNSDVEQIKKSAKAAVLLLPLLGITHMFEVYHDEPKNWIINLIFSIINAFLVFYQGVFLSILYCFMNNEVKDVVRRHWCVKIKLFNSNGTNNINNNNNINNISNKPNNNHYNNNNLELNCNNDVNPEGQNLLSNTNV